MSRPALGVAVALLLPACDRAPAPSGGEPPSGRTEAIAARPDMPTSKSASPSTAPVGHELAPGAAEPPRTLCDGELSRPGRPLAQASFTPVSAPAAEPASARMPAGRGRWTWINFFAAWCGPCKEEMPRLRGFEKKLGSELEVRFVSLDDDERQLRQFLARQATGPTGVRAALWLEPGKGRTAWLTSLGMKDPPVLPAHALVDPAGNVRCVFGGAVADSDLPAVSAIVRQKP